MEGTKEILDLQLTPGTLPGGDPNSPPPLDYPTHPEFERCLVLVGCAMILRINGSSKMVSAACKLIRSALRTENSEFKTMQELLLTCVQLAGRLSNQYYAPDDTIDMFQSFILDLSIDRNELIARLASLEIYLRTKLNIDGTFIIDPVNRIRSTTTRLTAVLQFVELANFYVSVCTDLYDDGSLDESNMAALLIDMADRHSGFGIVDSLTASQSWPTCLGETADRSLLIEATQIVEEALRGVGPLSLKRLRQLARYQAISRATFGDLQRVWDIESPIYPMPTDFDQDFGLMTRKPLPNSAHYHPKRQQIRW